MTRRQLRIGVLGFGRMGRIHGGNVLRRPDVVLAAIATPNPERAARAGEEFGVRASTRWQDVVEDPDVDAVVVASPADAHVEQVVAASAAGKDILCEKPIALALEGATQAVLAALDAGVVLHVGFQRRHDPAFGALRAAVAAGRIGEPWLVRICSRDLEPPPERFGEGCGGLFMDMAIHDFDMARFVLGQEVVEISSYAKALVDRGRDGSSQPDAAVTTLVFESGALGVVENCRQSAAGYDQRVEVHGRSGTLSVENTPRHGLVVADAQGSLRPPWPHFFEDRYVAAYEAELAAFSHAARRRRGDEHAQGDGIADCTTVAASGEDGRRALALAVAGERSAVERRPLGVA